MKELPPEGSFPRDVYPSYFALYDGKMSRMSDIWKESQEYGKKVKKLLKSGEAVAIPANINGKKDKLIMLTIKQSVEKIVDLQLNELQEKAKETGLGLDGEPRIG